MKIAWFANFFNHHMCGVMDELNHLCGGDFWFVCTTSIPKAFIKNGYPVNERPYIANIYTS